MLVNHPNDTCARMSDIRQRLRLYKVYFHLYGKSFCVFGSCVQTQSSSVLTDYTETIPVCVVDKLHVLVVSDEKSEAVKGHGLAINQSTMP